MSREAPLETRAEELRAAFDASFAHAPAPDPERQLDLLAIRVAQQAYALQLSELTSLVVDRQLVPVPSPLSELLGLLGIRGQVIPVYDLSRLLGYRHTVPARWIGVVRASVPFGLAFEHFESHLRMPASHVVATATTAAEYCRGFVQTSTGPRPLLDSSKLVASVLERVRRQRAPRGEKLR